MTDPAPVITALLQLLQGMTLVSMLVALFALVIPIFPSIVVIWLLALVYAIVAAIAGKMDGWDWLLFGLITILMIIGSFIDNIIMARKLRETGTPWGSIAVGFVAGLVSSLFLTPFAAIVATPLALFLAEYHRLRDARAAMTSTKGWLIGFSWTLAALFVIGGVMIGLWMLWVWV